MAVDLGEIDALLFDVGGVVIDIDFARVFTYWAQRSGRDSAQIADRFSMNEPYRQHEVGQIDGPTYFDSLRTSLGLELSERDLIDGWLQVHIGVMDGIDDILSRSGRRWPLFGFTNSNPTHSNAAAARFAHVLGHFDVVFQSFVLGLRKPDHEAFEVVAKSIGVPPERILFFDDSPENVNGAQAYGMPAVLVRSTADIRHALRLKPVT